MAWFPVCQKMGEAEQGCRRKGTGGVTAGSELPLGLAVSLKMQLGTQEIKPGNSCGNLGSNCRSQLSSTSQLLAEQTRSPSCRLAGSRG